MQYKQTSWVIAEVSNSMMMRPAKFRSDGAIVVSET